MFEEIKQEWQKIFSEVLESTSYKKILQGTITKDEYAAICRQYFFYTSTNPQVQALTAVHFKGEQRRFVKSFFKHAISEIDHDLMALNDLQSLGYDIDFIDTEEPLAQTQALIAYPFFLAQFKNPISYLGYLFHLEFAPTTIGKDAVEGFMKAGIPLNALTFLTEHATVDVAHNKFMKSYVDGLVRTEQDFKDIVTAMRNTAEFHTKMMDNAILKANRETSKYEDFRPVL